MNSRNRLQNKLVHSLDIFRVLHMIIYVFPYVAFRLLCHEITISKHIYKHYDLFSEKRLA